MLGRRVDVGITLVIAQQNIEARFVLLDETVFEYQRLSFGICYRYLDTRYPLHHSRSFWRVVRPVEVAGHPFLKVAGFAYVDDLVLRIEHAIHARPVCQGPQEGFYLKWRIVTHISASATPAPSQILSRTFLPSNGACWCCSGCSDTNRATERTPHRAVRHDQI